MFRRRDYPTIQDGLVVRYEYYCGAADCEISASRNGISLQGRWPIFSSNDEIDMLFEILERARIHFRHLKSGDGSALDEDIVNQVLEVAK